MKDIKQFIEDVRDMRALQVEYFKSRNPVVLKESKCLEMHIDRRIQTHLEELEGQTHLLDQLANEKGSQDD